MSKKRVRIFKAVLVMVFILTLNTTIVRGQETVSVQDIFVDTPTLTRGYTVVAPNNKFFVGIRPEVLAQETRVVVKQFDKSQFDFPHGYDPISDVYEFDIFNKDAFQNKKPLLLKFIVDKPTENRKRIFFYNGVSDQWVELPSYSDGVETVKSIIHLPYAKMVILEDNNRMEVGVASWYHYRGCNCAASPDYPKGTKLKVTNLENNKSVIITVNDYGPDRSIHPERVIDLDSVAFKQLGELWQGILPQVKVEKVDDQVINQ